MDERDGEMLDSEDVVKQFFDSPRVERLIEKGSDIEPIWFKEFRENVNSHLIKTQRLLSAKRIRRPRTRQFRPGSPMVSTVDYYAEDLSQRIRETMARYGRQSQALDQSFPQRLLQVSEPPLGLDDLKSRMSALDATRDEYKEIRLLDETAVHPFDIAALDNLDATQQRVMTLYVQDTAEKLGALEDLARRTKLLLENVNRKFRHKQIRVDRERGFVAEGENSQILELGSLSSGEQHELVMHYDLLFRVRPNTLVLIDEPELSLHVAWQKRFLPDLLEIVQTANFDALIATHSPFIVGDRSDLMITLGEEK